MFTTGCVCITQYAPLARVLKITPERNMLQNLQNDYSLK